MNKTKGANPPPLNNKANKTNPAAPTPAIKAKKDPAPVNAKFAPKTQPIPQKGPSPKGQPSNKNQPTTLLGPNGPKKNGAVSPKPSRSTTPRMRDPKQGKVSQYSIHFTKRREFEKEQQMSRTTELEKARNQHYGMDTDSEDQKKTKRYGVLKDSDSDDDDRFYSKKKPISKSPNSSQGGSPAMSPSRQGQRRDSFVQTDPVDFKNGKKNRDTSTSDSDASHKKQPGKNKFGIKGKNANRNGDTTTSDSDDDHPSGKGKKPMTKKKNGIRKHSDDSDSDGGYPRRIPSRQSNAFNHTSPGRNVTKPNQSSFDKPHMSRTPSRSQSAQSQIKKQSSVSPMRKNNADTDNDGIDTEDEMRKKKKFSRKNSKINNQYDTDNDGIDTEDEMRKKKNGYKKPISRKPSNPNDTDNDGIDTEEEMRKKNSFNRKNSKQNPNDTDNDGIDTEDEMRKKNSFNRKNSKHNPNDTDNDGIDTEDEMRKKNDAKSKKPFGNKPTNPNDTDNDGIDTDEEVRKKMGFKKPIGKKPTNPNDTDNDGIDTDEEIRKKKILQPSPNASRKNSVSGLTSAERRRRMMDYEPPRKNSINTLANKPQNSNLTSNTTTAPNSSNKVTSQVNQQITQASNNANQVANKGFSTANQGYNAANGVKNDAAKAAAAQKFNW